MAQAAKSMNLYNLPPEIIERICQFSLDSLYWPCCTFILGRVKDLLNLGLTCKLMNYLVKNSLLRFRLAILFNFGSWFYTDTDNLKKFLKWAKKKSSWRCDRMLILGHKDAKWQRLHDKIIPMMRTYAVVFSAKVKHLFVDEIQNFHDYNRIIAGISWLLSSEVVIDLRLSFDFIHNSVPMFVSKSHRLKRLMFDSRVDFPEELPSGLMRNVFLEFENLVGFGVPEMRPSIWREIVSCRGLVTLTVGMFKGSFFNSENSISCGNIQHLEIYCLISDLGEQEKVMISKIFTNLISISIYACFNPNDNNFELPQTCEIVKLDTSMLKYVLHLPFIKHIMLERKRGLEDEINHLAMCIRDVKFQLETFVYKNVHDKEASNKDSIEKFAIPFLQSQPSLKILAIDSNSPSYDLDPSDIEQNFVEAATILDCCREILDSHHSLQYFRWRCIFLVLKMSMKPELFNLISNFDDGPLWEIASSRIRGQKVEPQVFRISSLTMI